MRMTNKIALMFATLTVVLCITGCGRRGPLDTPVSYEQATPGSAAAQAAVHPPIGPDGKPIPPLTQPEPQPAARSFPLDPLLD